MRETISDWDTRRIVIATIVILLVTTAGTVGIVNWISNVPVDDTDTTTTTETQTPPAEP